MASAPDSIRPVAVSGAGADGVVVTVAVKKASNWLKSVIRLARLASGLVAVVPSYEIGVILAISTLLPSPMAYALILLAVKKSVQFFSPISVYPPATYPLKEPGLIPLPEPNPRFCGSLAVGSG